MHRPKYFKLTITLNLMERSHCFSSSQNKASTRMKKITKNLMFENFTMIVLLALCYRLVKTFFDGAMVKKLDK